MNEFDVIIIGGGHAGAEAAWAASRLGAATALITLDAGRIAQMSCNPAIGGLAKGQMVREIDALGGIMGLATDSTGIQFRMLNLSKGPAVWGPRCQSDNRLYPREVQRLLATCANLTIVRGEGVRVVREPSRAQGERWRATGVELADGTVLRSRAVVVTTGTFLRGLMHTGEAKTHGGRFGEPAAGGLCASLAEMGLELGRLKTGTPPRLARSSIDFSAFEEQWGDARPWPFSYLNEYEATKGRSAAATKGWVPPLRQVCCHLTATTSAVHEVIRANLHRAPMYSGQIQSTGPRYCPSIEDKVVRFAQKTSHHIFLEPEALDAEEIYCNGISTSLPAEVQRELIALIPGLERAKVLRYGYAVEYDMVWPNQIHSTLAVKGVDGLFLAGQINGTSGYEEAAAQGLVAGVNAARLAGGQSADWAPRRDQAYIGVLIDDLVTKPPIEPYRMFTSRAEHRLHLRSDNADERLTEMGREIGLVDDARWERFVALRQATEDAASLLAGVRIGDTPAGEYIRRPEATWEELVKHVPGAAGVADDVARRLMVRLKYAPYIVRQNQQIERFGKLEARVVPAGIDFETVAGLRTEAKQKFGKHTPRSLGQALRISGITPADVMVLAIHLDRKR